MIWNDQTKRIVLLFFCYLSKRLIWNQELHESKKKKKMLKKNDFNKRETFCSAFERGKDVVEFVHFTYHNIWQIACFRSSRWIFAIGTNNKKKNQLSTSIVGVVIHIKVVRCWNYRFFTKQFRCCLLLSHALFSEIFDKILKHSKATWKSAWILHTYKRHKKSMGDLSELNTRRNREKPFVKNKSQL